MQKKFIYSALLTIFCASLFACTHKKDPDPFVISSLANIQILEKQDHNFCASLKLEYDKSDNLKSLLYWRCRMSQTKYRLFIDDTIPSNAKFNLEISDLISKIAVKIADTPEAILLRENRKMDNRQHQLCLRMGFQIYTDDQAKIDEYFSCRRVLLEDQKVVPPFGNVEYLKYPNDSYNIGFVVDHRVDESIKKYILTKEKYPTCIKYNLYSLDFKNCSAAQDNSRKCLSEIPKKKFAKEVEEKIACQKKSYIAFPDEFLKDTDQQKQDIERTEANSDYYNNNNFAAIGISDFAEFGAKPEKMKKEKKVEVKKNINSKEKLYTRLELTKLRGKFIVACMKEADVRVSYYVDNLQQSCNSLILFREVGAD